MVNVKTVSIGYLIITMLMIAISYLTTDIYVKNTLSAHEYRLDAIEETNNLQFQNLHSQLSEIQSDVKEIHKTLININ